MGAFLAALGAVLLFVLKAVGILLLVVLVLVVLLLLCPFCADLCWEHGVLTVRAGALGITFPVFQYPKPEPPPAPENPEPPKGFGKVKAKFAAWRAERKRKKAEEKARKKAAAAAGKPARPRKKAKITLEIICTMLRGAGTSDEGGVRGPAYHKNTGAPWRARGGPCCSSPRLRQAAGVAVSGAGRTGSVPLAAI